MSFRQRIINAVKKVDFFYQPINLRYNQQPDYQTFTGGFVSIALIIILTIVFTGNLIQTFNRIGITYSSTEYNQIEPMPMNVSTNEFMFAMGITGQDMNEGPRWFDIHYNLNYYNNNTRKNIPISLQKCTREQWAKIDQEFGNTYDRIHLQKWLCPPPGLVLQLEGKFTSKNFRFSRILVGKCNQTLNSQRPCVADSQINDYLNKNEVFNFNFYFVNKILNPGEKQYKSNYIQDFNFFPFSPSFGVSANLFLAQYEITTDESITPLDQTKVDKGWIIKEKAQSLNYQVQSTNYLKLYLRKSSINYVMARKFQKLDETLSYIGGLFSTILTLLIILKFYNRVSFELDVAKTMYKYDKEKPLDSQKFNFFYFIGFMVYKLFLAADINLPWKKMEMYHNSLLQVKKQMDVRLLFRKIQFSQKVTKSVLEPHQIKIVHLQQRLTLRQAQEIRQNYDFYDKLQKYYLEFESNSTRKVEQQNGNKQNIVISNQSLNSNTIKNNMLMQNTSFLCQFQNKVKKKQHLSVDEHIHMVPSVDCRMENKLPSIRINQIVSHQHLNTNNVNNYLKPGVRTINYRKSERLFNVQFPIHFYANNKRSNQKEACQKYAQNDKDQTQLKQIVKDLKQCILYLKQQASLGQKISERILRHMDRKIIYKLIQNTYGQTQHIQIQSKAFLEQLQQEQKQQKIIQRSRKSIGLSPRKTDKTKSLSYFQDQQLNQFEDGSSINNCEKYDIQPKIRIQTQIIAD